MLHGEKEAKASEETAKKTFSENSLGSGYLQFYYNKKQLDNKINIID